MLSEQPHKAASLDQYETLIYGVDLYCSTASQQPEQDRAKPIWLIKLRGGRGEVSRMAVLSQHP